ncbi:dof zinc finger protein DOF5.3-like [Camellia sinensis]|uniref:Dof zinc finger protein n=1 Tax=Camellia sinensis var. sinensis TaxID=542762 RepID=A0A4S4E6Y8_CAMSN|nr:dof zinc finger protein DOF5.3-like [Camellia sinensis]THG11126.1 hypothetical protein TEA_006064 [Camellia sinensis var. sinensis]
MEQEEGMKQQQQDHHHHHHRRLKPPQTAVQSDQQTPQPQQQPQKCPRCDSLNTKFCYYNNYSLSQPRYFCKTCRRYWTQGGTLRNVPVGGGCRKGKRSKAAASSSGGENSRSSQPSPTPQTQPQLPQPPPSHELQLPQNLAAPDNHSPMSSYYSGSGFLSSLAAMQSMSHHHHHQLPPPPAAFNQNQSLHVGGQFGGSSSNMALLQGFNVPSFSSQQQQAQNQQIQHQNEYYQMGNRDKNLESLYPSDQSLIHPNRPAASWNQTLTANPGSSSNPSFWNPTTTNNSNTTGTSSLNPNQWSDLQGYGHPP